MFHLVSPIHDTFTFAFPFVPVFMLIAQTNSVSFNFTGFKQNDRDLVLEANATVASGFLQLTNTDVATGLNQSEGRASYAHPVPLWDRITGNLTDFTTTFSFKITPAWSGNCEVYGDGITFYLAPTGSVIPPNSSGGYLGLVSEEYYNDTTKNQIVAVELDTYENPWDPSGLHLGIDIGSVVSIANTTLPDSPNDGLAGKSLITYTSTTKTLSVLLSYSDGYNSPKLNKTAKLSYNIDLATVLPENVRVGLSAATGSCYEVHQVLSWNFSSTLQLDETNAPAPAPESDVSVPAPAPESASTVPMTGRSTWMSSTSLSRDNLSSRLSSLCPREHHSISSTQGRSRTTSSSMFVVSLSWTTVRS